MRSGIDAALARLARAYGVQTAYTDASGRRRRASADAVLAVLRAMGAPVTGRADVAAALREREAWLRRPGVSPVLVAWDGELRSFELRGPPGARKAMLEIRLESGESVPARYRLEPGARVGVGGTGADGVVSERVVVDVAPLPPGYHRLTVEAGGERHEAMVVSAPRWAYLPDGGTGSDWGVFLPLYALRGQSGVGTGDITRLGELADWVHELGGGVVGTLPLLAPLLDAPFEPGPYSPASRLFWNELYADPERAPELELCPAAKAALESATVQADIARLRSEPYVDYGRLMRVRRAVLRPLARCFFESRGPESQEFRRFLAEQPELVAYARFQATCERRREPWPEWPARARGGDLHAGDYDEDAYRYHIYVQWLLHGQLSELSDALRRRGQWLYLDLPLGVHPAGFDVWRHRELFADGVTTGSPPDAFFALGQDWGFPPMRPDAMRTTGYAYTIATLRANLRYAGMLRIDHVMALHRLFWVPQGMPAAEGLYVRYPAEELYAILCLESQRHRAVLVGEDLGTVPREVRRAMSRHRLQRMWVLQFEVSDRQPAITEPPRNAVTSANTHDTPTFAAFWNALDVEDRHGLGLLDEAGAASERVARAAVRNAIVELLRAENWLHATKPDVLEVLRACLARMAASRAGVLLVNLEDLWGETRPQNTPGTGADRKNWRRVAALTLESFRDLPDVVDTLTMIRRLRSRRRETR